MQVEKQNTIEHIKQPFTNPENISEFVPFPVADPLLSSRIFDFLQLNYPLKNIRKGINEVLKHINKENVEMVIMAANVNPPELLSALPAICENNSVTYCFVPDAAGLGRACGIKRRENIFPFFPFLAGKN